MQGLALPCRTMLSSTVPDPAWSGTRRIAWSWRSNQLDRSRRTSEHRVSYGALNCTPTVSVPPKKMVELQLLLVCLQLRHTLKKIVNFRIHGELRCCKLHNCVFEVICRHPGMSHVHHYCVMKAPMLHLFSRPKYPPKRRERKMRNSVFFIASQWVITMYLYGYGIWLNGLTEYYSYNE